MRRLLRDRNARLYVGGQTLSTFGDSALWLAMAIWVKMLTGSSSAAGLVFFAFIAGSLLAPLGGLIADRVPRRRLLIAANLAGAALVCVLLAAQGRRGVWLVYPVMFGYGAVSALISAAQNGLLPTMLPADLLGEANSALQLAGQGLRVLSPLLGAGLLAAVGAAPVIALDAATFVAAAGAVAALRLAEAAPAPAAPRWRDEVSAGIRHLSGSAVLRRLMLTGVIAALAFGFFETVPFAVVSQGLHRSPAFVGVLEAMVGVGALAGGLAAPALMRRSGERGLVALGLLACGAGCALFIPAWIPSVLVAGALVGVCIVWVTVGISTLLQRRTPPELLGRVGAALDFAITVPQAASIALGAALIALVDYRILLVGMALVVVSAAAYLITGDDAVAVPGVAERVG